MGRPPPPPEQLRAARGGPHSLSRERGSCPLLLEQLRAARGGTSLTVPRAGPHGPG